MLTGEGVQAPSESSGDGEVKVPEGYSEVDPSIVVSEMSAYASKINELLEKEEVKSYKDSLLRDFVVLVAYIEHQGDKVYTKFENVNVLVGPKPAIETVLPVIESFIKTCGSNFKTVNRI